MEALKDLISPVKKCQQFTAMMTEASAENHAADTLLTAIYMHDLHPVAFRYWYELRSMLSHIRGPNDRRKHKKYAPSPCFYPWYIILIVEKAVRTTNIHSTSTAVGEFGKQMSLCLGMVPSLTVNTGSN
jgi:hypothetical protein